MAPPSIEQLAKARRTLPVSLTPGEPDDSPEAVIVTFVYNPNKATRDWHERFRAAREDEEHAALLCEITEGWDMTMKGGESGKKDIPYPLTPANLAGLGPFAINCIWQEFQ